MNLLRLTELYFPEERQEYATNNIFNLYKYNKMKMVSWMWKGSSKDKNKQQDEADEDQLKKKGFNPQGLELGEAKEQPIMDFSKDYEGFVDPVDQKQSQAIINQFKFFPNEDEHRHELGHAKGGKICGDKRQVAQVRSIGKEMIKIIGKKLISGDLNLTRISFPIKAMVPKTALENSTLGCCMMPYFLKRACETEDPVEKMKFVITSIISSNYYMNLFMKPLNPVLGQTLEGSYADGTKIYCQQISHHPPISYFIVYGPNNSYKYTGYYSFEATAGLNSMTLMNKGRRTFEFQNGDKINVNYSKETFAGVFIGSLRSETIGGFQLVDQKNSIKCQIKYGKVKKKPSDYIAGSIMQKGKSVSQFDGTYCGFLNFDDVRYWDGRYMQGFKINLEQKPLPSDFRNREDLNLLKNGQLVDAQTAKQKIEDIQRRDAKLREQFKKKK